MSENFNNMNFDTNECTSRGVCSISPGIESLQELVRFYIMMSAFYIVKLNELNLDNYNIKNEIISIIASLIYINEHSEKQMYLMVLRCYYIAVNSKDRYLKACSDANINPSNYDCDLQFTDDDNMAKAISCGEKLLKSKNLKLPYCLKYYQELLFIIVKSLSLTISRLSDLGISEYDVIDELISAIYSVKVLKSQNDIINYINKLAKYDVKYQNKIIDNINNIFGNISVVFVSHSTRKGKCILVSGDNFADLEVILELTKDKDIDVYSHSNLIIAHAFKSFKKYKHFIGNYGNDSENCIIDYATFPGAILLTKNSKNNTEYLYRGKIYSNDFITPQGVIKIENNNYYPLIDAALNSKGFSKGKIKHHSELGYKSDEFEKFLIKLSEQIESGKLKHIYIFGLNVFSEYQNEYFKHFSHKIKQDEFVISFGYFSEKNNIVNINLGNYFPLFINLLCKIVNYKSLRNKITLIYTTCDSNTFSNIIYMKNQGLKNIYLFPCNARAVNPSVFDTFIKEYDISILYNAENDLLQMRRKNTRS